MAFELNPSAQAMFRSLQSSGAVAPMIAWLRRVVTEGSDFDCYKINAFRAAEEVGVSGLDAVRSLLFATRLGLTDLFWDVHCPSCMGLPAFHKHLMQLQSKAHCPLCELRFDVEFEDQVEVTFTVNPVVRVVATEFYKAASWPAAAPLVTKRLEREGRFPTLSAQTEPGVPVEIQGPVVEGEYSCSAPGYPEGLARLRVEGEATQTEQRSRFTIDATGGVLPRELQLRPGPARFIVESRITKTWGFSVRQVATQKNWVSASYVTGLQDFRDLFSGEFLGPGTSFAVRSTTLLFTDVKGSTEMYEKLGDAAAYSLVQDHFEKMTEVIRRYEGGIIKTIGDAVMASFPTSRAAVAAALEIQEGFARFNPPLSQIKVKIGIHRGPAIAVTSNRMLDFFGRTVNIAARVQGESRAGEVLLSEVVANDAGVQELLAQKKLTSGRVEAVLKGIAGKAPLTSLFPPGAA